MMRRFVRWVVVVASSLVLAVGASHALAQGENRVVIQVSDADPARWNLALNNVKNLQDALGAANVSSESVAYGPGSAMLKVDAPTNSRIAEAIKSGVAVQACENTMRGQKLVPADMHPSVTYVPAGVVEIIQRQQQGWAYLRP